MSRFNQVVDFIDYDRDKRKYIEPEFRFQDVKERLFDIIETYHPEVIVKAGLGNEKLIIDIIEKFEVYLVVIEPSFSALKNFYKELDDKKLLNNIKLINGDFHEFPVDYFSADLIISIDYLDFFDSSRSLEEFKRSLQFEGILFLSSIVLENDDIDGIYDDFRKMIFPLHNDFYLESDLKTFVELKNFTFNRGKLIKYSKSLKDEMNFFNEKYNDILMDKSLEYLKDHMDKFKEIYEMDDNYSIREPYFIGAFTKNKAGKDEQRI